MSAVAGGAGVELFGEPAAPVELLDGGEPVVFGDDTLDLWVDVAGMYEEGAGVRSDRLVFVQRGDDAERAGGSVASLGAGEPLLTTEMVD